jgi:hypothetical protein
VQGWFARAFPGSSPYRLFALSNFASMLALLGYPFLFEPWFTNPQQSTWWSAGYALFALLCAGLAWSSRSLPALDVAGGQLAATAEEPAPRGRSIALWLALSTMGSVVLLGGLEPPHAEHLVDSAAVGDPARGLPAHVHPLLRGDPTGTGATSTSAAWCGCCA